MEPVGTMKTILTHGPWRHSVGHSLGSDRGGAGSQGKRESPMSGNRERAHCEWVVRLAQSGGVQGVN